MDLRKCTSINDATSLSITPSSFSDKVHAKAQVLEEQESAGHQAVVEDVDVDLREIYFLIMHFLSLGPCQRTFSHFWNELLEHQLLPRRYHAWYSRDGELSGDKDDDGISLPLSYDDVVQRYNHIGKDHLVMLLKQLILSAAPLRNMVGRTAPCAADVPTLLGTGPFSLFDSNRNEVKAQVKPLPSYLRWPHMQADQVRGLSLRELGGGFTKHHRAPSIRFACYAIAKPSTMLQKMENIKKLRGHRDAVYCAIFDRSGRYVITGSDDRLVKIWSMETAFCLASCRGHVGDITDLAVSSNNALVASASNDFTIRVWRLPDGMPISTLRGHEGAVTAIAFSPRQGLVYQLLSSSDDGTCRIWDARCSQYSPRIYLPRQTDAGKINGPSLSNTPQSHQILCCAYNASGSVFVTGSSDTFARVWSAGKSNADDSEQQHHEIDVLAGHENDVNYVQFSGTGVTSRSLTPDSLLDDKIPRYRSSWYSHDNIVTCSRDGSAIIWIPRSRRSHGKVGRWTRAYHLKVPPPPMPPQPPRGGPRQRLLPTPRGVNMIVWSLDNRFVLAAIMDNRICVWNASDGSLVHSLTGHTASTYVLDVHPFNPRIAMSAGYDGKTIIWDIWEGTPIRIYDTGRFKLVDGKFSLDGTSIVLSDDVGQIYLINTGQGESQKDSKYDQFFLGDYRPLTRDTNGNTVDQETQLAPYRRNIQDPLCDSSMLPYPEPYQSMYQRRRLGALNLEWRPSSIKFAVGTDIGLGQEIQILPLADLDIGFEPPPEFIDAMFWEPDDVINDSTDSEYNITEEYSSEDEHGSLSSNSSDPECSTENKVERSHKDSLRRSKRKKHREEVDMSTSYGRRIKRRNPDVHDGTSSRSKRSKISRNDRSTKKKKSSLVKSLRPQRFSARNLKNSSSHVESSTDEDSPEDDSSESESVPQGYLISKREYDVKAKISKGVQAHSNEASVVGKQPILQTNTENRKKLILKFSIRDSKKSVLPPEDTRNQHHSQANVASSSSSRPGEENLNDNSINTSSGNPGLSLGNIEGGTSQEFVSGDLMPMLSDVIRRTDDAVGRNHSNDLKDNPRPKPTILRIKSKKAVTDSHSPLKIKLGHDVNASTSNGGDVISKIPNFMSTELADASYRREKFLEFKTHPVGYGGQELASTSEAVNHNQEEGSEVFAAVTEAMCRTRSLRFKTASRETYNENSKLKGRMSLRTSSSAEKSYKKVSDRLTSHESASTSGITSQSGTAQRKSNDAAIKSNWLLSSEQQLHRYIPQLYDEVMYFRQGHKEYNEKFKFHSLERALSRSFGENIRAVETCLVEDISYAYAAGSGESCCKIGLKFIDQSSKVYEKTFKLTLSDSNDFPDFVVEKTRYDAAIRRNWSLMDKCTVWWRHESGTGGTFWDGQITEDEDRSSKFPGSPWERYAVHYEGNDEPYYHSPWELHDSDTLWEPPEIDLHIRDIMLHSLSKLRKKQDKYGILKLEQHTQKSEYINGCALPLTLEIIEKRLQNNYYRNVDALGNDIMIMIENFQISFQKNAELTAKMKRLSNWFDRVLKRL